MSEKLLPCPFCGGEASLALTNREDERSGYRATFSAYCKTCSGMTARTSTTDKNGWNNEGDESIKRRVTEAWNRRTPAPEGVGLNDPPLSFLHQRGRLGLPGTSFLTARQITTALGLSRSKRRKARASTPGNGGSAPTICGSW